MKNKKQHIMPVQAACERRKNFDEVALGLSSEDAKKEAARCLMCKNPKCVEGCPVNIDIPGFIKFIVNGDPKGALAKIKETNMLPAVCGRVCPQENQCEKFCIRGNIDSPVEIGYLERFAADFGASNESFEIQSNGKKVAIVGSGPSGLTCAAELRKLGYGVTVFEALHELGGVLTYGIPEFRLPKKIVKSEIASLSEIGVEFQVNHVIGQTIDIDELLENEGFNAVYISTGAGYPHFMGVEGEDLNYVYSANEFLTRINLMKAHYFPETDTPVHVGNSVAVIGGGNTAMDAARCALRLGPEKVFLIYRRSRNEMPARKEEVIHAEEEGIRFEFLTSPVKYIGDKEGSVKKIICQRMTLGDPDAGGRQRPVAVPDSNFEIEVDSVIVAIGTGANQLISQTVEDIQVNSKGYIITDEYGRTSKKNVYAGGDIVTGSATVIKAMGAGKIAARVIHCDLCEI